MFKGSYEPSNENIMKVKFTTAKSNLHIIKWRTINSYFTFLANTFHQNFKRTTKSQKTVNINTK